MENDPLATGYDDINRMKKAWLNEQFCPELLPYQEELVKDLMEQAEVQGQTIEKMKGQGVSSSFVVELLKMELIRVRYIISRYHLVRLHKIQKYHAYILVRIEQKKISPKILSQTELDFLKNYQQFMI
eukprot:TRINITY_DN15254_c0_g1_i1.p1 TRINITY_DN15254_c0_g1~~TRINITY_DN15254_c0_g1_i1.p1  ORF type:complete len:128 (-),score=28.01 TRINITY_DN15254_c0_g1_i1:33-416(-)